MLKVFCPNSCSGWTWTGWRGSLLLEQKLTSALHLQCHGTTDTEGSFVDQSVHVCQMLCAGLACWIKWQLNLLFLILRRGKHTSRLHFAKQLEKGLFFCNCNSHSSRWCSCCGCHKIPSFLLPRVLCHVGFGQWGTWPVVLFMPLYRSKRHRIWVQSFVCCFPLHQVSGLSAWGASQLPEYFTYSSRGRELSSVSLTVFMLWVYIYINNASGFVSEHRFETCLKTYQNIPKPIHSFAGVVFTISSRHIEDF